MMTCAYQMGLFTMTDGNIFGLNTISDLLVSDHPLSMCGLMSFMAEDYMTAGLSNLDRTLQCGEPSFELVHGKDFYNYLHDKDTQRDNFNSAMQCIDKTVSPILASAYDWSGVTSVVDLAGGVGSTALFVLRDNPHIQKATVLEVPDVVEKAAKKVPQHKISFGEEPVERLQFQVGDMFDATTIPDADAYMLKNIVHDWNDSECDRLLTNVAVMMNGDASKRVLVVEKIVPPKRVQPNTAGHDIVKMLFFSEQATHRSVDCFRRMFSRNGFEVTTVVPLLNTDYFVIEGRLNPKDVLHLTPRLKAVSIH
jgi:hypothetical protein